MAVDDIDWSVSGHYDQSRTAGANSGYMAAGMCCSTRWLPRAEVRAVTFDEQQLRSMTPQERQDLMLTLTAMEAAVMPPDRTGDRRRAIALAVIAVCCLALAAWTGVLAATLPRYYRTGGWRGAWVGFDLALLAAFAATGWASWRRRQVLIICLVVLATLLCCDAWFDVVLDAHTKGFWLSLLSALLIELPLAALAIFGARRLLHMTSEMLLRSQGHAETAPRLRHMRLVGTSADRPLHDLLADPTERLGAPEASIAGERRDG